MKEGFREVGGAAAGTATRRGKTLPFLEDESAGQAGGFGLYSQAVPLTSGRPGDMLQVFVHFLFRQAECLGDIPGPESLLLQEEEHLLTGCERFHGMLFRVWGSSPIPQRTILFDAHLVHGH